LPPDRNISRADDVRRLLAHPIIARLSARLAAFKSHDAPITEGVRLAAVTALVRIVEDATATEGARAELLLIKRAAAQGDPWSGHIALPGGRYELFDETLAETARREMREEVAIDIERDGKLLGRLDDLAPRSLRLPSVIVRPFVGVILSDVVPTANREVAAAFWVPVSALRAPEAQAEHTVPDGSELLRFPAYQLGEHLVWGLTERMLAQLLPMFD
jgi:8-oxo-dGTP pyrophosphatase MutT (NUDIX family)